MTITIPDWIFCGLFLAGFGTGTAICVLGFLFLARNFNPFGR